MRPEDVPPVRVKWIGFRQYREVPFRSEGWVFMGIAPLPRTTWQTIRYHILHGLIMQYPLWSILKFAWRNRHSFKE